MRELVEQYKSSMGIYDIDIKSEKFILDFFNWVNNQKKLIEKYVDFLNYMEFDYKEGTCAEVGKGKFDSVVIPFDTRIITKESSIIGVDPSRIIMGDMIVLDSKPTLVESNKYTLRPTRLSTSICTYMTQNPISKASLLGWDDLHNSNNNDIILGVYGNTNDKDKEAKINMLKEFKEKLLDEYKDEYCRYDDSYFYVIGSNRKRFNKIKTLSYYLSIQNKNV